MNSYQPTYHIYTDGACSGNPGSGGWAAVIDDPQGITTQISGGFKLTTNNRMELVAVIKALQHIPVGTSANVTTDSQYVVNAIRKGWLTAWQQKHWRNAQKKPVANRDLWEQLISLLQEKHVIFHWIRGHMGHPKNELCDVLAVAAYTKNPQTIDEGYVGVSPQKTLL